MSTSTTRSTRPKALKPRYLLQFLRHCVGDEFWKAAGGLGDADSTARGTKLQLIADSFGTRYETLRNLLTLEDYRRLFDHMADGRRRRQHGLLARQFEDGDEEVNEGK